MSFRRPAVAGTFYDSNGARLRETILEMYDDGGRGKCTAVVSPHAGYVYSGSTAALAIHSLQRRPSYFILGPNHTGVGKDFSLGTSSWETPLGRISVDERAASRLADSCGLVEIDETAHSMEHSIEVQIPIMKVILGEFRIIPICIMGSGYSEEFMKQCEELGKAIASIVKGGKVGIVASSDFSHYVSRQVALSRDSAAIDRIMALDVSGFFESLEKNHGSVCGYGPIAVVMNAARELGLRPGRIGSSDSGMVTGDADSVVSYHALGFE